MSEEKDRLEINWLNSAGSALAAVSSAVVLSTLGTAGTLIGAAIGSLVITVGGAFYAHSLRAARRRLAAGRTVLVRRDGSRIAVDSGEQHDPQVAGAGAPTVVEPGAPPGAGADGSTRWERARQVLRELPWKRLLVVSAAVFAVAMAAILAFEVATGRPVSSYTGGTSDTEGGTSVPGIGGGAEEQQQEQEPGDGELPQDPEDQPEEQPEEEPVAPEDEEPTPAEETVEPAPTTAAPAPEETAAP